MKFLLVVSVLLATNLAFAKKKTTLRVPASVESQKVVCTVGDGKEGTEERTISKTLKKNHSPSIDEVIGDFRIMAQWMPGSNALTIGVIEEKSLISSSTLVSEKNKVGNLFVVKNGQNVDLSCYFN